MQPNDPRQQQPGFQGSQPIPQQPQAGVPSQPQPFTQPQQPGYGAPQPQPNPYSYQQQPMQPMSQTPQPTYQAPQQSQPPQYLSPLEPSAQQFQPLPSQPAGSGAGKKVLLFSLVLIVVFALGVGGYLFATKSTTKKTPTVTATKTTNTTAKTPKTTGNFQTLGSFTLTAPTGGALGGMTANVATSPDAYTVLSNSNGSCTIGLGVLSQTALPGTDLNSLVAIKIADAKKQDSHIKVSGPKAADSLVLKDTTGKTYALPTASFTLTDSTTGGGTIVESYSAVELADKSHAVVYTACNSDKANDQTALAAQVKKLLPVAQAITIQPK